MKIRAKAILKLLGIWIVIGLGLYAHNTYKTKKLIADLRENGTVGSSALEILSRFSNFQSFHLGEHSGDICQRVRAKDGQFEITSIRDKTAKLIPISDIREIASHISPREPDCSYLYVMYYSGGFYVVTFSAHLGESWKILAPGASVSSTD